jgi:hypothetical protein
MGLAIVVPAALSIGVGLLRRHSQAARRGNREAVGGGVMAAETVDRWSGRLGRVAVPTGVWERPEPLRTEEWELVRLHPYHSGRILARSSLSRRGARVRAGRGRDSKDERLTGVRLGASG